MTRRAHIFAVFICALLICGAALGDIIILTNGREIRGEVISESGGRIVVRVPGGTLSFPRSQVATIRRENPADYRMSVAKDLFRQGKSRMAVEQLRAAVKADPRHSKARRALIDGLRKRAVELEDRGSLSAGRTLFKEVLALAPGDEESTKAIERMKIRIAGLRQSIKQGMVLVVGGKAEQARALFEGVLDDCPEMRPELAKYHARALIGVGDRAYAKKDYAGAASSYTAALGFGPELAANIEPRYINTRLHVVSSLINSGHFEKAEAELAELHDFSPTNIEVKFIAGRYEEIRGRFANAADLYASALGVELAGARGRAKANYLREKLTAKLDARRVKKVERSDEWMKSDPGDWQVHQTEHFAIHHHNEAVAAEVGTTAEHHYERIIDELGLGDIDFGGKGKFYIHRDAKEYRKVTGQPEWSGGVTHSKMRGGRLADQYISSYQTSPKLLKSVIPHELTHMLFSRGVGYGKDFPLALHEGVAVAMEPGYKQRHYKSVIWNHIRTDTLIPMGELLTMADYPVDHELFYAQGARLVQMLLERGGSKKLIEFSKAVDNTSLARALKRVYGIEDLEALDKLFRDYVKPKTLGRGRKAA